jgi:uncharacterized protein YecE (DUF72 family)
MERPRGAGRRSEVRIGISGWNYPPWRGVFYPPRWPHRRELEYAGRIFNSVEINGSFYSLQRPESFRRWYQAVPEDFVFAIKGSRFLTHMKKLREPEIPLANFFASGLLALEDKLGPILWQLGPHWPLDLERVERFLELLPRTTAEAARLARRHDERVAGRAWTRSQEERPIRYAFEPRHPSFFTPPFVRLLRRHKMALVFADTAGIFPYAEDVTADFVYLRLHGAGEIYAGGYDDPLLEQWARRIEAWTCGGQPADARNILGGRARRHARRDAYVYFDNDAKVRAPFDARSLAERLTPGASCDPDEGFEERRRALLGRRAGLRPREFAARRAESALRWKG